MNLADWGAIGNIILGIASVFTAIVTARMLSKQHELQKEQHRLDQEKLNAQQLEHQPSFQFTRTDDKLIISNQGSVLSTPIKSTIYSMVIVQTEKSEHMAEYKQCIYCHPVRYYERFGLSTLNLNGELDVYKFKVEDRKQLLEKVKEIYMGILHWKFLTPHDPIVSVQSVMLTDLIKIEYVDMYHKSHVIYYKDSQIITKDRFEQLVEISRRVPFGIYDVENVIPDNIIRQVYATNFELTA
ncbi:MAG: hypothetical protein HFJ82_04595 [Alistipes sp.]|jgi:hypothetical protein|uniref:hypothetical protein n=1 Tax=uncultured Alistipes sp. TaxID=538949 RepID=UPI002594B032|nr:hypothetical protein [uncultured Alistipes sp.]MCI9244770.1 hypothetical protein [Alistipes sp.]